VIHLGPLVLHRPDPDAATTAFAVGLLVPTAEAPRVALRARPLPALAGTQAPLPGGAAVEVVGVTEGPRVAIGPSVDAAALRFVVFEAEAVRVDAPYATAVIAEVGAASVEVAGPVVPARAPERA
jgi:hypothetical protein